MGRAAEDDAIWESPFLLRNRVEQATTSSLTLSPSLVRSLARDRELEKKQKTGEAMLLTSPFVSPLRVQVQPVIAGNGGPTALRIEALKQMTGRVVTTKADKTVGVEVVRLAPHPKYKRRERIKKKYQAHDPDNQFKVGDIVELRRSRPISKTKHFLAVPLPPRDTRRKSQLLPPLQSQSQVDEDAGEQSSE